MANTARARAEEAISEKLDQVASFYEGDDLRAVVVLLADIAVSLRALEEHVGSEVVVSEFRHEEIRRIAEGRS